jgi:hypothetical protein
MSLRAQLLPNAAEVLEFRSAEQEPYRNDLVELVKRRLGDNLGFRRDDGCRFARPILRAARHIFIGRRKF